MIKKLAIALLTVILFVINGKAECQTVTMKTLLDEMTERENIARFPAPEYTTKQFSSYNKSSVTPDHFTWFANLDNNYFIRTEENEGRREFVLFDADGPGAVVRFWTTFNRYDKKGVFRFYFDNEKTPRLEGEPMELISGGKLAGEPLSFSVSEDTEYARRGHNLYLPIPYGTHLKITYETNGIREGTDGQNETNQTGEMFYYQINYRTYKPGVKIESYDRNSLTKYKNEISAAAKKLADRNRGLENLKIDTRKFNAVLDPGAKNTLKPASRAVRNLRLRLDAADIAQALRSTVISISFDGNQTVWAPVGDFFGAGYRIIPASTWYQQVNADGSMDVYWVMPFKSDCTIELINYGTQKVSIQDGQVATTTWKWDDRSMYFGTSWQQNTKINTGLVKERDGRGDMYDLNFTTIKGKGVYVGDGVTLFNCSPAWWGEGDEKIFVDGESFPSHFGTGTEDYYGYAWCRPEKFIHPFIAQPDGSGNLDIGYTVDMRYRTLDAIPFTRSLKFDMEMWHWGLTIMNYAPITYWYVIPGGNCEIKPDIAGVRAVVTKREQLIPSVMNDQNIVEGEDLVLVSQTGKGMIRPRPVPVEGKPNWTRAMMGWNNSNPGDEAVFRFISPRAVTIDMNILLLMVRNPEGIELALNGTPLTVSAEKNNGQEIMLKSRGVNIRKGDNELKLRITENTGQKQNIVGIDYISLTGK